MSLSSFVKERCFFLFAERTLEDHENIFKACKKWRHHHNHNRLYFRKDFRKYEVFENPEVREIFILNFDIFLFKHKASLWGYLVKQLDLMYVESKYETLT